MGWVVVVANKTLLSAPVPWIGDLGLGLDNNLCDHYINLVHRVLSDHRIPVTTRLPCP